MLILDQLKKNDPQLRILSIAILLAMGILLAGLWYVQVVASNQYVKSLKTQSFRTVRVPAVRGKILDRHGEPLAINRPSYNVSLYLEDIRHRFEFQYTNQVKPEFRRQNPGQRLTSKVRARLGREARYRAVSNVVSKLGRVLHQPLQLDAQRFARHYRQNLSLPLPILENLEPNEIALFHEQPGKPPGLDMDVQPLRLYPHGKTAAHILGFLNRLQKSDIEEERPYNFHLPDFKGMVGVEGAFDKTLRGEPGVRTVLVNNMGYRESSKVWPPAEPGNNLVLTLNLPIQQAVEKAMRIPGPSTRGAAVVMDTRNGDILAMASVPAFDPNSFVPRISMEEWNELQNPVLRPQVNRAVGDHFHPGSIFKLIVGLAGLEAGVIDPHQTLFNPGHIKVGHRTINDTAPPGEYDFVRAMALSSNHYFIHFGLQVGVERILDMARQFRLGEKTGIPTEQEVPGSLPSREWIRDEKNTAWRDGDTANLCIGQGAIDVTPIQMAVVTAAIANGGTVFAPRLVARIEPPGPHTAAETRVFPQGRVRNRLKVQPDHLALIRQAMRADVASAEGTGRRAAVPGMRICGKTGTAEVQFRPHVHKHTWFVSFAPYENPRYAVVVMVVNGASGGSTCAPIARRIYQAIQQVESQAQPRAPTLARAR